MLAGIILFTLLTTTIITGDSYSKSTVINEVEGEGNVYTRIEVEANGEKKILESSQAGKYELEVKNSGFGSSGATIKSEVSISDSMPIGTMIRNILDSIIKIISKMFHFGS